MPKRYRGPALVPETNDPECNDFRFKEPCWVTVNNLSVWLRTMDNGQGLIVEVYPRHREAVEGPLTGCSVRFADARRTA